MWKNHGIINYKIIYYTSSNYYILKTNYFSVWIATTIKKLIFQKNLRGRSGFHVSLWTNTMEQSPSGQADGCWTYQLIYFFVNNPKVHYHVHMILG